MPFIFHSVFDTGLNGFNILVEDLTRNSLRKPSQPKLLGIHLPLPVSTARIKAPIFLACLGFETLKQNES